MCQSHMVIRIDRRFNFGDRMIAVLIGELLIADGAGPVFDVTGRLAGCCLRFGLRQGVRDGRDILNVLGLICKRRCKGRRIGGCTLLGACRRSLHRACDFGGCRNFLMRRVVFADRSCNHFGQGVVPHVGRVRIVEIVTLGGNHPAVCIDFGRACRVGEVLVADGAGVILAVTGGFAGFCHSCGFNQAVTDLRHFFVLRVSCSCAVIQGNRCGVMSGSGGIAVRRGGREGHNRVARRLVAGVVRADHSRRYGVGFTGLRPVPGACLHAVVGVTGRLTVVEGAGCALGVDGAAGAGVMILRRVQAVRSAHKCAVVDNLAVEGVRGRVAVDVAAGTLEGVRTVFVVLHLAIEVMTELRDLEVFCVHFVRSRCVAVQFVADRALEMRLHAVMRAVRILLRDCEDAFVVQCRNCDIRHFRRVLLITEHHAAKVTGPVFDGACGGAGCRNSGVVSERTGVRTEAGSNHSPFIIADRALVCGVAHGHAVR